MGYSATPAFFDKDGLTTQFLRCSGPWIMKDLGLKSKVY